MSLPALRLAQTDGPNVYHYDFSEFKTPNKTNNLRCQIASRGESRSSFESLESTVDDSSPHFQDAHFSFLSSSENFFDSPDSKSMSSNEHKEDYTVLNCALNQKKKIVPDDSKFKTEMCKNWSESGQCPYGKKCKFAHGKTELNEKRILNQGRYKSKKCSSFHTHLACSYGVRCLFTHEQRSAEELKTRCYYEKYFFCPDLLNFSLTQKKRRLPIFQSVSQEQKFSFENSRFGDVELNYFSSF